MSGVLLLSVLDIARALGIDPLSATPDIVAEWLLSEYLRRKGGRFNYDPATNATFDLMRGAATLEDAVHYCSTKGNPLGRESNTDAIKSVAAYALKNLSRCYRIGFSAVVIGRAKHQNIYAGIKAPMVRVKGEEAFVVMPGYRMSYRPVEKQIDFACSVAVATLARDDFSKADFEYLYAGPGESGEREFRAIQGRDRTRYDRDTIDALLDVYVKGVGLAIGAGADAHDPDLAGYRIIDPNEPPIF